ncbi:MAG TPA: hypothetical protein VLN57_15200 [Xanthobacteraceae bacterium]|nr:hypothetical protein [Xanthobacteraceae bacterium]
METFDGRGNAKAYYFAMGMLRRRGAKLVRTYSRNPAKNGYTLTPSGIGVDQETAKAITHRDVRPYDGGLLPGHPQSRRLSVENYDT